MWWMYGPDIVHSLPWLTYPRSLCRSRFVSSMPSTPGWMSPCRAYLTSFTTPACSTRHRIPLSSTRCRCSHIVFRRHTQVSNTRHKPRRVGLFDTLSTQTRTSSSCGVFEKHAMVLPTIEVTRTWRRSDHRTTRSSYHASPCVSFVLCLRRPFFFGYVVVLVALQVLGSRPKWQRDLRHLCGRVCRTAQCHLEHCPSNRACVSSPKHQVGRRLLACGAWWCKPCVSYCFRALVCSLRRSVCLLERNLTRGGGTGVLGHRGNSPVSCMGPRLCSTGGRNDRALVHRRP